MIHIANYSEFKMYLPDEHFETKWGSFTCLIPVEPKLLISDLFFNNYETVRRIDRSNYTFFLNRYNKQNLLVWFWQHQRNFWIWPLYKLSCDPQASCTGCDPAVIWHRDPWTHTNIIKLSNLLFLFSWLNFASVWPKALGAHLVTLIVVH